MKKILEILIIFVFGFHVVSQLSFIQASTGGSCGVPTNGTDKMIAGYPTTTSHTITIDLSSNFDLSKTYHLTVETGIIGIDVATSPNFLIIENQSSCNNDGCVSVDNKVVTWTITTERALKYGDGGQDRFVDLVWSGVNNQCDVGKFGVEKSVTPGTSCSKVELFQNRNGESCYQNNSQNACFINGESITLIVHDLKDSEGKPWNGKVGLRIDQLGGGEWDGNGSTATDGYATMSFTPNSSSVQTDYLIYVEQRVGSNTDFPNCKVKLSTQNGCGPEQCEEKPILGPESLGPDIFDLCSQIPKAQSDLRAKCIECAGGINGRAGIWTAIGCIKRDPKVIIRSVINLGLGIGGGIALITFLAAGFIFSTSQGSPERVKNAKEMMTSSVIGLLFVIFSVAMLQFIGWSVLKIPGFGG